MVRAGAWEREEGGFQMTGQSPEDKHSQAGAWEREGKTLVGATDGNESC
jgi:hypothetical protein